MRLIDADELPEVDTIERVDGERDVFVNSWIPSAAILKAPTVDAIPIEWIMKTIEIADRVEPNEYARYLRMLLKDWRIERWNRE